MDFKSINNKRVSGDQLRMTEPSLIFNEFTNVIAEHTVQIDEVGRVDLIARAYYKDVNLSEYILKFNNIANPFELAAGDVIFIPDAQAPLATWNPIKEITDIEAEIDNIRGQFIDTKRLSKKDAARLEYLQRKAASIKNGSKQILPPNILKAGEENLNINNGEITI
jgi:hypothetical protein